jgi:hypothetical protein
VWDDDDDDDENSIRNPQGNFANLLLSVLANSLELPPSLIFFFG